MDWFCSWIHKKKEVIQVYKPINNDDVNKVYPKSGNQVNIARSTPSATVEGIKRETERVRPIKEFVLPTSESGYINIKELKAKQSGNNILRKIQKSEYEEEYLKCKAKQTKWIDPNFPHELVGNIRQWKRITDIIPDATFMKYPIKPNQIIQGQLNDCYWMCAVASLAERDYRIKNIFGSLEINPYGIYMCKLTYNGIYQEVVVDDYFPVDENDHLVYARPYNGTDFWGLILEKCWAKLFNSYDKINWGYNPQSLSTLTGAPVKEFECERFLSQADDDHRLFEHMMDHETRNHLITCTIYRRKDVLNKFSLQVGHAYSILGVFETSYNGNKVKLIQVRNPLGSIGVLDSDNKIIEQPNVAYNAKDQFWKKISPEQRNRLQYWMIQKPGDGIFYVEWSKFLLLFDQIAFCAIEDNSHYLYETKEFKNGQAQYVNLQVDEPTQFYLMIAQPNQRRLKKDDDIKYASISVLVARVTYNYANQRILEYVCARSYNPSIETNYFPVNLGLQIGGSYTIRINVSNPVEQATSITIGFYSPDDFAVKYLKEIDDNEFLYKTLLNKASKSDPAQRKALQNAKGWHYIENIIGSDLSYIAYHVDASSESQQYRIKIDESKNSDKLYFLGHEYGKTQFEQTIKKGEEIVFIYSYEHQLEDPDVSPEAIDPRELPKPIFEPL